MYNNLGDTALVSGDVDAADRNYRQAHGILVAAGMEKLPQAVVALTGIGKVHLRRRAFADAAIVLEEALLLWDKTKPDPLFLADTCFTLARVLHDSGRDRKRAHELARRAGALYAEVGDHADAKRHEVEALIADF